MPTAATILISEFMTSGLWPNPLLTQSLAREGAGMLLALVEDVLHLTDQEVVTTWDTRLGDFPISHPNLKTIPVDSVLATEESLQHLLRASNRSLFIAPEFHGLLQSRVDHVNFVKTQVSPLHISLNCDSEAISICADKLRLAKLLQEHDVSTIATSTFNMREPSSLRHDWLPIVIKPRDGAGSQATFRIDDFDDLDDIRAKNSAELSEFELIQQPFIAGRPLSMAAIISPSPRSIQPLPLCEQLLSHDGRFHFLGTRAGAFRGTVLERSAELLVRRCCDLIPGLNGYIGFDLIEPTDQPNEVVLVEINPRLTTSYLAYRQLADFNLAAMLLDAPTKVRWRNTQTEVRIE